MTMSESKYPIRYFLFKTGQIGHKRATPYLDAKSFQKGKFLFHKTVYPTTGCNVSEVRACVRVCVRACVNASVRACVHVSSSIIFRGGSRLVDRGVSVSRSHHLVLLTNREWRGRRDGGGTGGRGRWGAGDGGRGTGDGGMGRHMCRSTYRRVNISRLLILQSLHCHTLLPM